MLNKASFLFLLLLLNISVYGQICHPQLILADEDGECDSNPYLLVFEDNFNGDSLDQSKWQIQPWGQGSLTNDNTQQYYSLDNVSVSAGTCSITSRRDTVVRRAVSWLPDDEILADSLPNLRTYYYTSSNIWTYQRFRHGKYEIRCRIPYGKGFWPAFWMYGADSASNSEIDVFEFWDNNTHKHHMTAHYSGLMCTSADDGPDYSQAFHTFTVIWDPYQIEWYVDDVLKRRLTRFNSLLGQNVNCDQVNENYPYLLEKTFPEDSMNIITNLAIQNGDFAPDSNTVFPAVMEIDYIRYYARIPSTNVDNNANIQEDELINIKVFPNPGNGTLSIDFDDTAYAFYELKLRDEKGDLVFSIRRPSQRILNIDVSSYKSGIYILHIHNQKSNKDYIRKIFIK